MNDTQKERNETRLKYLLCKDVLPNNLKQVIEKFFALVDVLDCRKKYAEEVLPSMLEMMKKQYPALINITNTVQLEWMSEFSMLNAETLHAQAIRIVIDCQNNVDVLTAYPKLEKWRNFYTGERKPKYLTDADADNYYYRTFSNEERDELIKSENRKIKLYFDWKEKRKNEYFEIMQPSLFRHIPELNDITGDWWVIYAVTIRDSYENWLQLSEEMEMSVEYNLPPESCRWDFDKFIEAIQKSTYEVQEASRKNRDQRIYSGT